MPPPRPGPGGRPPPAPALHGGLLRGVRGAAGVDGVRAVRAHGRVRRVRDPPALRAGGPPVRHLPAAVPRRRRHALPGRLHADPAARRLRGAAGAGGRARLCAPALPIRLLVASAH